MSGVSLLHRNALGGSAMKVSRFATQVTFSLVAALVTTGLLTTRAQAQGDHDHDHGFSSPSQSNALVRIVREATARFQNPAVAEAEGYKLQFGCVSGSDFGAMGMHF